MKGKKVTKDSPDISDKGSRIRYNFSDLLADGDCLEFRCSKEKAHNIRSAARMYARYHDFSVITAWSKGNLFVWRKG